MSQLIDYQSSDTRKPVPLFVWGLMSWNILGQAAATYVAVTAASAIGDVYAVYAIALAGIPGVIIALLFFAVPTSVVLSGRKNSVSPPLFWGSMLAGWLPLLTMVTVTSALVIVPRTHGSGC